MRVLAFFAHPDDETMLCGGLLALLAREGVEVFLLCATRGEGGELGVPPLCTREKAGEVRSQELVCAAQALGCHQLDFLDYIDPLVGPGEELFAFTQDEDRLEAELANRMSAHQIDVLITHGSNGEYGHPAHQLIFRTAARVVEASAEKYLWYTVQGAYDVHPRPHLMNRDDPAHILLNIAGLLPQKAAAALCHRTQHDLFVRRTAEMVGHPVKVEEVVMDTESLHRAWPPVWSVPLEDDFAVLLRSSGCVIWG